MTEYGRRLMATEVAEYYRGLLLDHADDLVTGTCPICQVTNCWYWKNAFAKLREAGEGAS